jgi:hypothetical protein
MKYILFFILLLKIFIIKTLLSIIRKLTKFIFVNEIHLYKLNEFVVFFNDISTSINHKNLINYIICFGKNRLLLMSQPILIYLYTISSSFSFIGSVVIIYIYFKSRGARITS